MDAEVARECDGPLDVLETVRMLSYIVFPNQIAAI